MIDSASVKARVAEFDAKHGASVYHDGWVRFEDGACREGNPLGALMDPPADPHERAKYVLIYWQIVLQRAVDAFEDRRRYFQQIARANLNVRYTPPPPVNADQAEAELRGLQAEVRRAQKAHDQAKAAVDATKPEAHRAREREAAANRAANEQLLGKLDSIQI